MLRFPYTTKFDFTIISPLKLPATLETIPRYEPSFHCLRKCSKDETVFCFLLDIDECASSPCDKNATCQNTFGSYVCTCNPGYAGDGKRCGGELALLQSKFLTQLRSTESVD